MTMNAMAYISGMPGGAEVLLILFIILLLFGAKKLPELSRSLGKSLGEFKKGKEDLEKEIRDIPKEVHEDVTVSEPGPADENPDPKGAETVKAPPSEDGSV